jgi:VanZ family protein
MPLAIPLGAIPFKDKGVHAVEYGVLAVLLGYAIRRTWLQVAFWRVLMFAALLTFAWGYLDELHQAFVPGRNSDAFDLLADTVGALLGSGLFGAFEHWRMLARRSA